VCLKSSKNRVLVGVAARTCLGW